MKRYDGTKLLSQLDINGRKPELYLSTTNRSSGKTTWFNRYCVKRFLKHGEKFMLLYRFDYELDQVADKFFKDIQTLFYPTHEMTEKKRAKGKYLELFLDGKSCGYVLSLNTKPDTIKKLSHFFSDTQRILFDEFQSETGQYAQDEVSHFLSILASVGRGAGQQVRYVPVYMIANFITLLNPYYIHLGIADKLQESTNFYRGDGFVLEQSFYQEVADAQADKGIFRAFKNAEYSKFLKSKVYLNDDQTFISAPAGKGRYLCTIYNAGEAFGIREYPADGVVYCSRSADKTFKTQIAVTTADMDVNIVSLRQHQFLIMILRKYFDAGCFRFENQSCKSVIFKLLSIK